LPDDRDMRHGQHACACPFYANRQQINSAIDVASRRFPEQQRKSVGVAGDGLAPDFIA
jgi:hypothetical protein